MYLEKRSHLRDIVDYEIIRELTGEKKIVRVFSDKKSILTVEDFGVVYIKKNNLFEPVREEFHDENSIPALRDPYSVRALWTLLGKDDGSALNIKGVPQRITKEWGKPRFDDPYDRWYACLYYEWKEHKLISRLLKKAGGVPAEMKIVASGKIPGVDGDFVQIGRYLKGKIERYDIPLADDLIDKKKYLKNLLALTKISAEIVSAFPDVNLSLTWLLTQFTLDGELYDLEEFNAKCVENGAAYLGTFTEVFDLKERAAGSPIYVRRLLERTFLYSLTRPQKVIFLEPPFKKVRSVVHDEKIPSIYPDGDETYSILQKTAAFEGEREAVVIPFRVESSNGKRYDGVIVANTRSKVLSVFKQSFLEEYVVSVL